MSNQIIVIFIPIITIIIPTSQYDDVRSKLMAVPIEKLYDNPAVLHSNDTLAQASFDRKNMHAYLHL